MSSELNKFSSIPAGKNVPNDINVIIEIPTSAKDVKYEIDSKSGIVHVDRISKNPVFYPAHYGYIPNTLCEDGDELDVLVICNSDLAVGCCMKCRPIGGLEMEDEKGLDDKIIAVPHSDVTDYYNNVNDIKDIPDDIIHSMKFLFSHYKIGYGTKWSKVGEFFDASKAKLKISESLKKK